MTNYTDTELLENFYTSHDNQWLGILLPRYTYLLLGVCMKYLKNEEDAKDCVQQIFLKAITELHKYKVDYIKSWLYMIAKNYCLMRLRDKNGVLQKELKDNLEAPLEETNMTAIMDREHTLTLVENSLSELNKEQQTCIDLFYLQKKSYQQICDHTGFSLLQIKSYIQNGKRNLKLLIEKKQQSNNDRH